MAANRVPSRRREPAHSLLYEPQALSPVARIPDAGNLFERVSSSLEFAFNERQVEAFNNSFRERVTLLWGPPGTGKTSVLAGIVLGWLENAWLHGRPVRIGVGSSNYNAIDNVLTDVANLLDRRLDMVGAFPAPLTLARVRGNHSPPPIDARIADINRRSRDATKFIDRIQSSDVSVIVGGTWMQLGKLAEAHSDEGRPVAHWFDLLLIDEASQVGVSTAAAYFLLLREDANVVLAGDHRQLGPIYGFQVQESNAGLFDCIFIYMQESHGLQKVALNRNYRTNDEIAGWPRERFYSEGYEAFHSQRKLDLDLPAPSDAPPPFWPETLPWSPLYLRILDPNLPVAVITYDAQTYTLSNPFEAQMVAAISCLYRHLLQQQGKYPGNEEFWTEYLGIVTPHRAQMSSIRNQLIEAAGMPINPSPFVDTVDRFQGLERDIMIASYVVADRDFVRQEEEFILNPRRFNVTLTRARSKFVMFISNAIVQHLPTDAQVARDAAHIQLFVEDYCSTVIDTIELPFLVNGLVLNIPCRLRGVV